eukprot:949621-Amphidinium_carterae.1
MYHNTYAQVVCSSRVISFLGFLGLSGTFPGVMHVTLKSNFEIRNPLQWGCSFVGVSWSIVSVLRQRELRAKG